MNSSRSKLGALLESAQQANQLVLFWSAVALVGLLPSFIARLVLEWTLTSVPLLIHCAMLVFFFGVLFCWASLISGSRGHDFFLSSYAHGIKWPLLYSVALLAFALPCFAALTVTLIDLGRLALEPTVPNRAITVSSVQDFYLWHFLDSVPGLEIPETLCWDSPFTYRDQLVGVILLAFKLSVIVPVIASFAAWNEIRKDQRKCDNPDGNLER